MKLAILVLLVITLVKVCNTRQEVQEIKNLILNKQIIIQVQE